MESHRRTFKLNRAEGKVLGVCAGIADHFGIDLTLVRIGMALAIFMTFPLVLFGYFILAAVAQSGGRGKGPRKRALDTPRRSAVDVEASRERMRDLDARMAAIETYVTSENTELAREIDELR